MWQWEAHVPVRRSAKGVAAIDPSTKSISEARKATPKDLLAKVFFRVGRGENLGLPDESFDVVFFAWSLCCADVPAMGKAIDEAWKVLKPKGLLANIQGSLQQPFRRGMISYLLDRNDGPWIQDEGDRHARLALKHSSLVERKFDLVAESEFPVYSYYDTLWEAVSDIDGQNGARYRQLEHESKQKIREILGSMKTKKGVRVRENAVLTVLRKISVGPRRGQEIIASSRKSSA